jgi:hypothetical protein
VNNAAPTRSIFQPLPLNIVNLFLNTKPLMIIDEGQILYLKEDLDSSR